MFTKKSKNVHPLPEVPTIEEIFADLETFALPATRAQQLQKPAESETYKTQPLQDWWSAFETIVDDVKELAALNDELKRKEGVLEEFKSNIEKEADTLKKELDEEIAQINEALDQE